MIAGQPLLTQDASQHFLEKRDKVGGFPKSTMRVHKMKTILSHVQFYPKSPHHDLTPRQSKIRKLELQRVIWKIKKDEKK